MKKIILLFSSLLAIGVLAGCDIGIQHVHTYDLEHWETTSTHHWHTSTCEHTGLASDLGEHTYNSDGKCSVCGYKKEVEHYSFLLRSDYCELDNENIYEEGEEVELSLTIKDEFKASSTLPENIEVYSKGVLLTKGTDYTYAIEGETGKLSLTVKGDIVVIAFKDKNPDSFKITETQFADAMNVSDESHLQYNLTAGFYSSFSIIMQQYDVEYSPNVTYRGSYSFDASRNGGSISCDYTYIEKENEAYTEYHSDKSGVWTTRATDEGTFNGMKSLSLGWFPFISGFKLTYDRIKDNFNSATNAYEVYFTYQEYDVKFEVTFYNGKLIDISYEGTYEADRGIFGNITVSYLEKDVSIPYEAKPHEHTFSEIWSIDETNHWHAATCEHDGLTRDLSAHDFGDDNICDTCGYIKPAPAHEHSFSDEWSIDETSHWHASTCEHSDVTKDLANHNYGNDNVCDVCGYEKNVSYTITYTNWPQGIDNPNPTSFDMTTEVHFDGTKILEKPGFSNVRFFVDSNEVTSTKGINKDITVNVCYDATITSVEIKPNNGIDESFIFNVSYWEVLSDSLSEYSMDEHEFVGWYDELGNKIDISKPWIVVDASITLTAKWKYTNIQLFVDALAMLRNGLLECITQAEPLIENYKFFESTSLKMFADAKDDLLGHDYSKEEAEKVYEMRRLEMKDKLSRDAQYDLIAALKVIYDNYLALLEGYSEKDIDDLTIKYNIYDYDLKNTYELGAVITVYNTAVYELESVYQEILELNS